MAIKKSGSTAKAKEFTYEVLDDYGVIGKRSGDWELRLRYVAFNGNEPKYDIRPWKDTEDGEKMGKGIQISGEELESLLSIIKKIAEEE